MQHYHTADCPPTKRIADWNDTYARRFAQVSFRPDQDDFHAELRVDAVGPLGLADVRTSAADIERTPRHIGLSRDRLFSFLLMVRGSARFSHYGQEASLHAGDFTLCDNAAPHRIRLAASSRFLLLRASPTLLRRHLACPERLCGLKLPGDAGATPIAAAMAERIWRQVEEGLPESYGDRIAASLLDMISMAYSMSLGDHMHETTRMGMRIAEARQFIEGRLRDFELSSATIATGLGISQRYLRLLFAAQDENVSAYILRRRLEECAAEMSSHRARHMTITEVAFRWGFNSSAYFARTFRQRYGMTATEYRRLHASGTQVAGNA